MKYFFILNLILISNLAYTQIGWTKYQKDNFEIQKKQLTSIGMVVNNVYTANTTRENHKTTITISQLKSGEHKLILIPEDHGCDCYMDMLKSSYMASYTKEIGYNFPIADRYFVNDEYNFEIIIGSDTRWCRNFILVDFHKIK